MKNRCFKHILGVGLGAIAVGSIAFSSLYTRQSCKNTPKLGLFEPILHEEQVQHISHELQSSGSALLQQVQEELAQEHKKLLEDLEKAFPLPNNQWETLHTRIALLKAQDTLLHKKSTIKKTPKTKSPDFAQRVADVAREYNLDPSRITLTITTIPEHFISSMQGMEGENHILHGIEINTTRLAQLNRETQDALIAHELMHLYNYDSLESASIDELLVTNNIMPEVYADHPAYQALARFQEYRADLLAASISSERTEAFIADLQRYIDAFPENQEHPRYPSHPTEKQRKHVLMRLAAYQQNEKT